MEILAMISAFTLSLALICMVSTLAFFDKSYTVCAVFSSIAIVCSLVSVIGTIILNNALCCAIATVLCVGSSVLLGIFLRKIQTKK